VDIGDKIIQQIIKGSKYGIKDWDISGGEPTTIDYWFDILKMLNAFGRNIACITNGIKFADKAFIERSKELGMNELLFSLHGPNATIHDRMTGVEGSFDYIVQALSNAIHCDITRRINVVVTKYNYRTMPDIAEYANSLSPVAFNFLPFRVENDADKVNSVRMSEAAPYIKEAIERLDKSIKISIRYVPFCMFEGYEQYVAGYLQREFDEYEWNEYTVRKFDRARHDQKIPELDLVSDKWELEIDALHKSIKTVANHSSKCVQCKYLFVCDGIWYSYANMWGLDEFKPIKGEKTKCIISN
jgi:MoaA/NifB/PqqE/SkfB family radical SAM enzyme